MNQTNNPQEGKQLTQGVESPANPFAFPQGFKEGEIAVSEGGMTLRDYFAAKAIAPLIASNFLAGEITLTAYFIADAMLLARATPSNEVLG